LAANNDSTSQKKAERANRATNSVLSRSIWRF
jgi:hypothetical protein